MNTTPNAKLPHGCGRQEELVTYLYDEATTAERASFEQHVDDCAACRRELQAFERVRHNLSAWQLPLAPRVEIAPQHRTLGTLAALRELLGSLSFWPKAVMGAATMAAMALIIFAVIGTSISVGRDGFSVAFGQGAGKPDPTSPAPALTRAEAEALIQQAAVRAQAQAQDETRAQLASLEERLNAAHQAELTKVTRRLAAEQRTMLANANRQEATLREWLFTSNDSREGGGTENDKDH